MNEMIDVKWKYNQLSICNFLRYSPTQHHNVINNSVLIRIYKHLQQLLLREFDRYKIKKEEEYI